ncbi:hypothetical protein M2202_010093 [Bradyrhizobium japonicum]|jgi:hypothetical protein|nr:hypothetical protein [Bradyrhizobium japonicum]MCP1794620.1 hypothetical protein [Bradyrhizobium japonicum]MCP1811114.1 hypothetical protein [Bradyrhizobium japonicum]MCP1821033.1 hypothetical protein [Bradyrhizobium japonicum]MCP1876069.1 hypothetical protein [Bradyrhizobium japonicum]
MLQDGRHAGVGFICLAPSASGAGSEVLDHEANVTVQAI